ncbi:MAG: hypothetical protein GYA24_08170 [Candidatus Lokiarchaeota archaeon]|nr:hypothetical protein [Candidatus Lokiarchaeota archaeon]
MSNASTPYVSFMPDIALGSDASVQWSPDVLPSTVSYTLQKNSSGLVDGDDVIVSTGLPVTQTSMSFENIAVQPITVPIETYSEQYGGSTYTYGTLIFQELKVPSSCYIKWVSLYAQYINITLPINALNSWNVSIYNATGSFPELAPVPSAMIPGSSVIVDPRPDGATGLAQYMGHWENVTLGNVLLNSTKTLYQGGYYHFFVAVLLPPIYGHLWWFSNDTAGLADDYGKAYTSITFPYTGQPLSTSEVAGIDFTCITKLFPVGASPRPSDIRLTVNNEPVVDVVAGRGLYTTSAPINPVNDIVTYDISSAWGAYPGGSFRCDTILNYTVMDRITPQVHARAFTTNASVSWRATYSFSSTKIKGQASATLSLKVPVSWKSVKLYNITGTTPVEVPGSIIPSPSGKVNVLTAPGVTPGSWRLEAWSAIIVPQTTLNIAGGNLDLDGSIAGTISITNGPNGRATSLRSDYEGGISSIIVLGGTANTTLTSAITHLDGKGLRLSNSTSIDLDHINEKVAIKEFTGDYAVNSTFDLWVDLPADFRISDVQDMDVIFDHESFESSWWWGNITGAAMPGNPYQWNLTPLPMSSIFEILSEVDLDPIVLNFTYDNAPLARHYADVYMNFSLNVFDELAVPRDAITSMTFDVVTNFTATWNHQAIYIRNQTSPTKDWILMNNVAKQPEILWFLHERWESEGEIALQDIKQFISTTGNTVEIRVRTYNDTTVTLGPTVKHHFFVDQATLNFTYANTFKGFDMQVYNWSIAAYESDILHFSATNGKGTTIVNLGAVFADEFNGLIDPGNGKIRVRIGAEALTPLVNPIWWDVDRIMLNITYTSFTRCTWNQTIFNSAGGVTYKRDQVTLYDSPGNNFTVSIPVMNVLDFYDDYNYTMTWTNGTDIMYYQENFTINRYSTTLSLTSGIDGDYAVAGSVIEVQVKLVYSTNGSGVADQPVSIVIRFNSGGTDIVFGYTNAQGLASVPIRFDDSWDSFTYEVIFTPDDPRFMSSTIVPSASIPVYNDLEFIGYLLRSYWYIIVPAIAVILIGAIVKRGSDARKKRSWKADANRIRDVVKIQHLMVIMKSSGACLVNRSYSQMQLDGDLISGFLHAIATFGKEVGGDRGAPSKTAGGDAIVFDYQDFKILLQEGAQVRLALILNGPPTESLKDRARQFISTFEGTYDMQNWRGSLDIFNGVDSYIEQSFEITLIYPLVVNTKKLKKDIKSGLGKALYEVGQAVQKEKQAFYLATLVNFAQAGRKESQDQVLGEIYQLKKQGFLTLYNPQAQQGT